MRYFKLAYDIFINKFLFNLLVILEIAAMLILTNTVIATYNSKKMLYEPYKEMLSHNGVVFINAGFEEGYYDDKKEYMTNIIIFPILPLLRCSRKI